MFIYRILGYFSMIASFLCIITLVPHIFTSIRNLVKKERLSYTEWMCELKNESQSLLGNATKPFLIFALLSAIITNTTVHQLVGIHNLHLKPEGTYCFYVEANRNGGKVYTLPAEVRIVKDSNEVDDEKTKTTTYYYVEKIYFSNDGWLNTEDNEYVTINEPTLLYDSEGVQWTVVLLNKHAYSPHVDETNNAGWLGVTLALIEIVPIAFLLYALCRKDQQ